VIAAGGAALQTDQQSSMNTLIAGSTELVAGLVCAACYPAAVEVDNRVEVGCGRGWV
jgi:hypothetical protein